MSETVKVLCYKSKILSNGEYPLMVCVCKYYNHISYFVVIQLVGGINYKKGNVLATCYLPLFA